MNLQFNYNLKKVAAPKIYNLSLFFTKQIVFNMNLFETTRSKTLNFVWIAILFLKSHVYVLR